VRASIGCPAGGCCTAEKLTDANAYTQHPHIRRWFYRSQSVRTWLVSQRWSSSCQLGAAAHRTNGDAWVRRNDRCVGVGRGRAAATRRAVHMCVPHNIVFLVGVGVRRAACARACPSFPHVMGWCERYPWVPCCPDPHLACWRAAECRHPTGREKMGSPTLQTLQDPILLLALALEAADQTQP
jgi:hypothetical protein